MKAIWGEVMEFLKECWSREMTAPIYLDQAAAKVSMKMMHQQPTSSALETARMRLPAVVATDAYLFVVVLDSALPQSWHLHLIQSSFNPYQFWGNFWRKDPFQVEVRLDHMISAICQG